MPDERPASLWWTRALPYSHVATHDGCRDSRRRHGSRRRLQAPIQELHAPGVRPMKLTNMGRAKRKKLPGASLRSASSPACAGRPALQKSVRAKFQSASSKRCRQIFEQHTKRLRHTQTL